MNDTMRLLALLFCSTVLLACGGSVITNEEQEPDPVVIDVPIAYIERDLIASEGEPLRDLTTPAEFIPGASLIIKARANASAPEVDLTPRLVALILENLSATEEEALLPIDIKDLESDYSGERIIFSARGPELDSMDEEPSWNIFEYNRTSDELRRIIASDTVAEAGDDTGPVYLPDGRIIFSSTRQRGNQARLLDEGKPQYSGLEEGLDVQASVLHIMDSDGDDIAQISFNQSHDLDPIILQNGKILFSRWDQVSGNKGLNLYQINPDGSDLTLMYGRHSHDSVEGLPDTQFSKASVTPNGDVLLGLNSFSEPLFGTNYVSIDIESYIDNTQPIDSLPSLSGPAQQDVLFDDIDFTQDISAVGFINALYPLWDGSGRILFSWSQCRLFQPLAEGADPTEERVIAPCTDENITNPDFELAPSVYGLWMFTPASQEEGGASEATQLPLTIPEENRVVSEVVAMESRALPANPSSTIDRTQQNLITDGYGVLHIQSVYDIDGVDTSPLGLVNTSDPLQLAPADRPARFLRVVKSVSIPDEDTLDLDNAAFGRSRNQLMREIVGYTPIQPDGSVEVAIPANIPFAIEVTDENGRRISQRHNNWLQLMPGEQKNCVGCHVANSLEPHGREDAQPASINLGAPNTSVPFPNTNPALFAELGETMAQTLSRLSEDGVPKLTGNIEFEDVWADPALQTPAESFSLASPDLDPEFLPSTQACRANWNALCRLVINYPDHIAPIINKPRVITDDMGMQVADNTCASCHSPADADDVIRVPAGQLDLTDGLSSARPDFVTSYVELMFNDAAQEVFEGAFRDVLVPQTDGNGNQLFARDEEGELILDAEGNPIPLFNTVNVPASMSVNGANNSRRFFEAMSSPTHQGMLSPEELRRISEWLDIGGQYYNNPFDAPEA